MELFAGDRRFPDPPRHGAGAEDSSMLVIRDALLSQLQKDRLRQEIILAELAKIERDMALRAADAERASPGAPFSVVKLEGMPRSGEAVGPADHIVAADVDNDLEEKKDSAGSLQALCLIHRKMPAAEYLVRECLKTSCGAGNAAGRRQNAALDGTKLQEPNETKNSVVGQENAPLKQQESNGTQTTLPKKTTPSSLKWRCDICRVEAPTEGHLQQHCAGQKHQSKVATLVSRNNASGHKAKAAAASSGDVRQYDEKPCLTWVCRFCQSNCTCKSDLENHLRGKRHKARIQCLLEECKNMAVIYGSSKSQPNLVAQDEGNNPASAWNCSLCQAKCTCQPDLANHLRGKRHQLNFLLLQVEGKQYLSEWGCGICQAKCNSVSQLESHWSSRGHQRKVEALRAGGQIASSEVAEIHKTTYVCKLCNLHCNSKTTLAEHRRGKNHTEKAKKRMSLSFCEVCDLQCNSKKMLAHHRTGKAHLAKLSNC